MKKLVNSPLTNKIYWATVNESKNMITGEKKDVTDNAIDVVFQHLIDTNNFKEKGFFGYAYEKPKKDGKEKIAMLAIDNDKYICIPIEKLNELKAKAGIRDKEI